MTQRPKEFGVGFIFSHLLSHIISGSGLQRGKLVKQAKTFYREAVCTAQAWGESSAMDCDVIRASRSSIPCFEVHESDCSYYTFLQ